MKFVSTGTQNGKEVRKLLESSHVGGWRVSEGLPTYVSVWAGAAAAVGGKSSP